MSSERKSSCLAALLTANTRLKTNRMYLMMLIPQDSMLPVFVESIPLLSRPLIANHVISIRSRGVTSRVKSGRGVSRLALRAAVVRPVRGRSSWCASFRAMQRASIEILDLEVSQARQASLAVRGDARGPFGKRGRPRYQPPIGRRSRTKVLCAIVDSNHGHPRSFAYR